MNSEPFIVLAAALTLDRIFGEPPDSLHPTVLMGRTIDFLDRRLQSGFLIFFLVTSLYALAAFLILSAVEGVARLLLGVIIFKLTFSWRGLGDYTRPIARLIENGDIEEARSAIPFIAGRDPKSLDREGVLSTAVESIAESSVDGIVSPLFYFLVFSYFGAAAGVAAAVFYRAANTLDSMLGTPGNPKGAFSARADEFLNLLPARLGAVFLLISSAVLGKPAKKGFEIYRRDRAKPAGRNSGQTMSVMAGVLGVRLEKKGSYSLGDPDFRLSPKHIYEALRIVDLQIILTAVLMVIAWILVI